MIVDKVKQQACKHTNKKFLYTREDWFDGDEDDIYTCLDCGARVVVYIPR